MTTGQENVRVFNTASGALGFREPALSKDAAYFSANPHKTNNQLLHKEAIGRDSAAANIENAEEDEEDLRERLALVNLMNSTTQAISFTYNNPEFSAYKDFANSAQWQEHSGAITAKAFDMKYSTALYDDRTGNLYTSAVNDKGQTTFYKVTEKGLVQMEDTDTICAPSPAGTPTFSSLTLKKLTYEQDASGQVTLYSNGKKLDENKSKVLLDQFERSGQKVADVLQKNSDMEVALQASDPVERAQNATDDARMFLENSENTLKNNYTQDNFIDREQRIVQLRLAEANLGTLSAKTDDEKQQAIKTAQAMQDDLKKMDELRTQITGASPGKADQIMAATFGEKYDTQLAQQTAAKQQLNAAAPSTNEINTSRTTGSLASEYDSAGDIGTNSKISSLQSAFGPAAAGIPATADPAQKPAPAAPSYTQQQTQPTGPAG